MPPRGVGLMLLTLLFTRGVEAQPASAPLRATTTVRIDGTAALLSRVLAVRPGPEATVLVGQPEDDAIWVFSATGQFLRKIGRSGSGPGDVESLDAFGVLGDTIWVADKNARRVTQFDVRGRVLRIIPGDTGVGMQTRRLVDRDTVLRGSGGLKPPLSIGPSGRAITMLDGNPMIYNTASGAPLFVTTVGGRPLSVLTWLPYKHYALGLQQTDAKGLIRSAIVPQPLGDYPRLAFPPNGARVVIATSTVVGSVGTIHLTHLSLTGDTLARHAVPFAPRVLTPRAADSIIDATPKGSFVQAEPAAWRAAAFVSRHYPVVTTIAAGNDGSVWIRGFPAAGRCPWTILSPAGRVLGTVSLAEKTTIAAIDAGGAWAIEVDADGIESVVWYRVSPAAE